MMTVHVLHAGDGYSYLTRQVANGDHTLRRGEELSDYYTMEGNPPGVWAGQGIAQLGVEGIVSESQMRALFGEGLHPNADAIIDANVAAGMSKLDAIQASRLGRRFPRMMMSEDGWNDDISAAYEAFKTEHGRTPDAGVERDMIRWNVASERVRKALGRSATEAEVSAHLAEVGKPQRQAVAGYDLVFTPVKSVSVLWGLSDKDTAKQVHEAHTQAWKQTLSWLEKEAGVTRVGAGGAAQIETKGLVATAFDHHDSRTGDPNLHTHVAVSNKVQGVDGKWRALDARVLHALNVSASERYNTLIEKELRERLGVSFEEESRGQGKRGVREIVGVGEDLREVFSSRRASIEEAYGELVSEYVTKHGHTPPRAVQIQMAQQATLDTREAKAAPKSLTEHRESWRAAAVAVAGERVVDALPRTVARARTLTEEQVSFAALSPEDLAARVIARVEVDRATWRSSHLHAEALRLARTHSALTGADPVALAQNVTNLAVQASLSVTMPDVNPVPEALQRSDGHSIYRVRGTERYTSTRILRIEDELLEAAGTERGFTVSADTFEAALARVNATSEYPLNASQAELARRFASGGHEIEVGIGPAGTGKTTAMRVFARAVEAGGGRVLALAPSATASTVLAGEIGVDADTAHKLIQIHRDGTAEQRTSDKYRIDQNTVLLIDEAGMASTPLLGDVLELALEHGAAVRLLGDPAQLAAVESGGALRLIEQRVGASYLHEVHRFIDQDEAEATLKLRVGDTAALGFYVESDRVRGGLRQGMLDEIYTGWLADMEAGKQAIMVAGTNAEVAELNARSRLDRINTGDVTAHGVALHDGNTAGVGDVIVTRRNERRLSTNQGRDFVKNGDMWTVTAITKEGVRVQSQRHDGVLVLPNRYVAESVELGYASTINRVQGMTVDRSHILVDPTSNSREQLYVAATRGRESNRMYTVVDEVLEADGHTPDAQRTSIRAALESVLARQAEEFSAHTHIEIEQDKVVSLATLIPAREDAVARVIDPDKTQRLMQIVTDVLPPEQVVKVTGEPEYAALLTRLAQHEAAGSDVAALLGEVSAPRRADARDTPLSRAAVLHHRLGPAENEYVRGMPSWVTTLPVEGIRGELGEVAAWVDAQDETIRARTRSLLDQTQASEQPWARSLPPKPANLLEREAWLRDMVNVSAYRDQFAITDTQSALGEPRRVAEYEIATASLARLKSAQAKPHDPERELSVVQQIAARAGQPHPVSAARQARQEARDALLAQRDEKRSGYSPDPRPEQQIHRGPTL